MHLPSVMAHTLSMESAPLWIRINPLLNYHFISHWILSVMRHQEPELYSVLKPGTVGFNWVDSQPCGFKCQAEFGLGLSPSTWVQVPIWGKQFQYQTGLCGAPGHKAFLCPHFLNYRKQPSFSLHDLPEFQWADKQLLISEGRLGRNSQEQPCGKVLFPHQGIY